MGTDLQTSSPPKGDIGQFLEILNDPDSQSADLVYALSKLRNFGAEGLGSVPTLRQLLYDESTDVREHAALTLAYIGPGARDSIPDLAELLKDPSPGVRTSAALALGSIGQDARCTVPELAVLLWDDDPFVRGTTSAALDAIVPDSLVPSEAAVSTSLELQAISGLPDSLEGDLSSLARGWWQETGQYEEWGDCGEERP